MTAPWDSDALWIKAKLLINYALAQGVPRTFDERALWATLSLEPLAKTALSRAYPLLIAGPKEDGKNLYAAADPPQEDGTLQAIPAPTTFNRSAPDFKTVNCNPK